MRPNNLRHLSQCAQVPSRSPRPAIGARQRGNALQRNGHTVSDCLLLGATGSNPLHDHPQAKVLLLEAGSNITETRNRLDQLRLDFPEFPILLSVDTTRPDAAEFMALGADDIIHPEAGEHVLNYRVDALIQRSFTTPLNSSPARFENSLAAEECHVWSTLFNQAGAGLVKGRQKAFLNALDAARSAATSITRDPKAAQDQITQILMAIEWELNNQQARDLLALEEPVALSNAFVSKLQAHDPVEFLAELTVLGHTSRKGAGRFSLDADGGRKTHIWMEFSIPDELSDVLLLTAVDITQRVDLETALRESVEQLEQRVQERTLDIRRMNHMLGVESHQRQRMTKQVRESLVRMTQGIISGKKILEIALDNKQDLSRIFPQSILIERPMDIMGGDFIFTDSQGSKRILGLVDSTGHGITGAMVSLMGSSIINKTLSSLSATDPARFLQAFSDEFRSMGAAEADGATMYGFDAGVIVVDQERQVIEFAGAKTDLFQVRNGETIIHKGTRSSIELAVTRPGQSSSIPFSHITIPYEPGDQFYMSTDGVRDQFGGQSNRKLGRKRLADMLAQHAHLPANEREDALQRELLMWKGANAKIDDATLVGIDC